jgi:hypothetical protein
MHLHAHRPRIVSPSLDSVLPAHPFARFSQCGAAYELTSSNPWLLRWLDIGNKGLSMVGRIVSVGSLTVVVSLGTGTWPNAILSHSVAHISLRVVYTKHCIWNVCCP